DGGPGIIQLHAPTLNDILPPVNSSTEGMDMILQPPPVGSTRANVNTPTQWDQLLPTFARSSRARSRWMALGAGHLSPPRPQPDPVSFLVGGTNASGDVLTSGASAPFPVTELAPIAIGTLVAPPALPSISADGRSLRIDGLSLADDIYRRNPNLLLSYVLSLT